jgi:FtsP/CotA-like multicopper oxidase with cupredoxin domain
LALTEETTETEELFEGRRMGRRGFLKRAGVVGAVLPVAGGMVVAACYDDPTGGPAGPGVPTQNVQPGAGGTPPAAAVPAWQKIDEDHQKGVVDFLKNQKAPLTKTRGMQELAPRIENGVKVWDLSMDEVDWEISPGKTEKARGYNKQIPGPTLRAVEGDQVRINVTNNLAESSAIHWHGIITTPAGVSAQKNYLQPTLAYGIPNVVDGVPYVTQDPIQPGKTYTYEFTIRNAGSHMYHSHHNSADQVNRVLLGAFVISPKDPATYPKFDKEFILIMNDSLLGFSLNGKGFPATDALVAKKGDRVLIRWMNEGMLYHPMHLHGMPMEVFQRDGYPISPPYRCDTIDVPPGNRFDCIIEATEPGLWAFHCHVLSHAEYEGGFFGLVTVLAVEDDKFKVADVLAVV